MNYEHSLRLLKRSFIGGGEGAFYFGMLDNLAGLPHIDWLDIGIGRDGSSTAVFAEYCRARGQSIAITGVDPDAEPGETINGAVRQTLVRSQFQLWTPPGTFDLINADQSLYYLDNLAAEASRIFTALRPGGLFIATCWLRDDTLHRIRQRLFPEAATDLVGEDLQEMLTARLALELINRTEYETQVDLASFLADDSRLLAAMRVIARGTPFAETPARKREAAAILNDYPPVAPRRNLALCFRRRIQS